MTPDIHGILTAMVHVALAGVGVWLLIIDARTHKLPNRIVLPTLGALVLLVVVEALLTSDTTRMVRSLLGMLLLAGFYAVMRLLSRQGVGGGDVKLAAVIGLVLGWHGWQTLAIGAASAFIFGALFALALMALRRADRNTRIAFGPWMIVGAAIGIAIT